MKLTIVGCGPACPNPGGASSGHLVETETTSLLVDCGHGVSGQVQRYISLHELSAILITHMHPDHFFDVVPLKYGLDFVGRHALPLYLPPDGRGVLDRLIPAIPLSETFFSETYQVDEYDPDAALHIGDLSVRFCRTRHAIPGWALRIESPGSKALFFSSDTSPDERLTDFARGSAVAAVESTIARQPESGEHIHMTPEQAASLARTADVERLVLVHYWSELADSILAMAREAFGPNVELARPGEVLTL